MSMWQVISQLPRSLHSHQAKTWRQGNLSHIIQAPPGQLKKPKTEKARGRPRLPAVVSILFMKNMQEDNSIENYNPQDEIRRILVDETIKYNESFEPSTGHKTCQDMATMFLSELAPEPSSERTILICFLNYMKKFTSDKYDEKYWGQNQPNDLIDISNQMVRELEEYTEKYPLTRELLIELLFVMFRWMYKNKWTDHKLVKRASDANTAKNNA